jgi:hypothetical protein
MVLLANTTGNALGLTTCEAKGIATGQIGRGGAVVAIVESTRADIVV